MNDIPHHPNRLVEWAEFVISVQPCEPCKRSISLPGPTKNNKEKKKLIIRTGIGQQNYRAETHGVNAFCAR